MFPIIKVFGYNIGTYPICTGIGIIVASLYIRFAAKKREDLDSVQLVNVLAVSGLGAFFGAHILFAITKWKMLIGIVIRPSQTFTDIESAFHSFVDIFGGMVFYGGLIGGIVTGFYYIRHLKHINLDAWLYADVYAPAIPLFHTFGRIGCFLGGCCYGIESKWGFVYHTAPIPESNEVVRFPIQLVEAAGNMMLFCVLYQLSKKKHSNGVIFAFYIIFYSIMRFVLEFFRGDDVRGFIWKLSTSQWISLILLFSGLITVKHIIDITSQDSLVNFMLFPRRKVK